MIADPSCPLDVMNYIKGCLGGRKGVKYIYVILVAGFKSALTSLVQYPLYPQGLFKSLFWHTYEEFMLLSLLYSTNYCSFRKLYYSLIVIMS